jgi:hypothetical protein
LTVGCTIVVRRILGVVRRSAIDDERRWAAEKKRMEERNLEIPVKFRNQ